MTGVAPKHRPPLQSGSCAATCICQACVGANRTAARFIYAAIFFITVILAWVVRDYSDGWLKTLHRKSCLLAWAVDLPGQQTPAVPSLLHDTLLGVLVPSIPGDLADNAGNLWFAPISRHRCPFSSAIDMSNLLRTLRNIVDSRLTSSFPSKQI